MTNAFLAEFDALASSEFAAVGMADSAQFRLTADDDPIPCDVLVDRGMQDVGNQARSKNPVVAITVFRHQVASTPIPKQSQFTIGTEQFLVTDLADNSDESRTVCKVRPA